MYLTKETEVDLRWIGLSWVKGKRCERIPNRRNSTVVEMPKVRGGMVECKKCKVAFVAWTLRARGNMLWDWFDSQIETELCCCLGVLLKISVLTQKWQNNFNESDLQLENISVASLWKKRGCSVEWCGDQLEGNAIVQVREDDSME